MQSQKIISEISELIEQKKEHLIDLSDKIWASPEIHFKEYKSSNYICEFLSSEGFTLERNLAGLETAFSGSAGSGGPVIAILGEFDALTNLSQKKGIATNEPIETNGYGHGCGHNLLGTGSLAAALAVKNYLKKNNLSGTIRYYGCPAEETGAGKAIMAKAGVFNDCDVALCWHPATIPSVWNASTLANFAATVKFQGVSSHAAAAPHLGRSALDAAELMNIGVNFLREHIVPEARVHYAITDAGGNSPNVVQSKTEMLYFMRAPKKAQAEDITERVHNIAKGAALMTGTTVEFNILGSISNLIPNTTLAQIMQEVLENTEMPKYDDLDYKFAQEIRSTLTTDDLKSFALGEVNRETTKKLEGKTIADIVIPLGNEIITLGSTDVGDVSRVVPTMQCLTACWALGTQLHTWQVVSQGAMPIAHKGMLHAGKILASTAISLFQNKEIIAKAKLELQERLEAEA